MRDVVALARAQLVSSLRERVTLFWFLVFPVFLLVILALIFGNVGKQGHMNFQVGLVDLTTPNSTGPDLAQVVVNAFTTIGEGRSGGESLFTIHRPRSATDKRAFIVHAEDEVRQGKLAAVIVVPRGFNRAVLSGQSAQVKVYTDPTRSGSRLAAAIIREVVAGVDREILARVGKFDPDKVIPARDESISGTSSVPYVSFLLSGVILMAFFTVGLFGVPGTIIAARDRFQLRRYWVTPVTVPRYLAGFSLGQLGLCLVQFFILFAIGEYGLGARLNFARPQALLFLFLGFITFLAFGFLIAAIAKTANGGMAIANILNIPLMFLGGLFFPVSNLSGVLGTMVLINPVTYVAAGLRAGLGLTQWTVSPIAGVLVPLGWIALSAVIASRRLSWEAER